MSAPESHVLPKRCATKNYVRCWKQVKPHHCIAVWKSHELEKALESLPTCSDLLSSAPRCPYRRPIRACWRQTHWMTPAGDRHTESRLLEIHTLNHACWRQTHWMTPAGDRHTESRLLETDTLNHACWRYTHWITSAGDRHNETRLLETDTMNHACWRQTHWITPVRDRHHESRQLERVTCRTSCRTDYCYCIDFVHDRLLLFYRLHAGQTTAIVSTSCRTD